MADARTPAQMVRADPRLLSPIEHRSEELQRDLTLVHQRENLVETRTRWISSVRGGSKGHSVGYKPPDGRPRPASPAKQAYRVISKGAGEGSRRSQRVPPFGSAPQ